MPTISEPIWRDKEERIAQAIKDYIESKPGSIDYSEEVLRARLFAAGRRGQDLETDLRLANQDKFHKTEKQKMDDVITTKTDWSGSQLALITQARRLAILAHGDQQRKFGGGHYWRHPGEVARILERHGFDAMMIAAAWLHDVVEDTNWTPTAIAAFLCNAGVSKLAAHIVTRLVLEVTDPARQSKGFTAELGYNHDIRWQINQQYIRGASHNGMMLKCADVISNAKDVADYDKHFAKKYLGEIMDMLTDFSRYNPNIVDTPIFDEARKTVIAGLAKVGV